jgi:hypothetical protein
MHPRGLHSVLTTALTPSYLHPAWALLLLLKQIHIQEYTYKGDLIGAKAEAKQWKANGKGVVSLLKPRSCVAKPHPTQQRLAAPQRALKLH